MRDHVLMTGASGFIGSHVLDYLLDNTDWKFTCICSWRHRGNPTRILSLPHYRRHRERVEVVTHDLRGPLPEYGPFRCILNLASESHVDRSIQDPVPFIENNVLSTLNMLEYARTHPIDRFIQFSTDEVYGSTLPGEKGKEWGTILPSNPYAASKAAQEAIAISYWRTYGVPLVVTNTNNIIGPGQDREKFVPRILLALLNDQEVEIHTQGGEMGSRFYNPVENVADALLFIMEGTRRSALPGHPERYNLGGGVELTNLELAQRIAKVAGMKLRYRLVDVAGIRPGYDRHYASADGSLTALGWQPPVAFDDGLRRTVANYFARALKGE